MQPWSVGPGTVEANVVFLGRRQGLPDLDVHAHNTYEGCRTLHQVAADIAGNGCQQPSIVEALVLYVRQLPNRPRASDDSAAGVDPGPHEPQPADDPVATVDSPMPESVSEAEAEAPMLSDHHTSLLQHRVQTLVLHLMDCFDSIHAVADPFQCSMFALLEALHNLNRETLTQLHNEHRATLAAAVHRENPANQ